MKISNQGSVMSSASLEFEEVEELGLVKEIKVGPSSGRDRKYGGPSGL